LAAKLVSSQYVARDQEQRRVARYLVERTFPDSLSLTTDEQGVAACRSIIANNTDNGVTWIHSYVTGDKKKSFCIYDAPSPEAIRQCAALNGLPVDRIIEVRVLAPYFHL
jgi:hypothetical protein